MAVTEGAAAMYAAGIAAAGSMGSAAVTSGRGHKSQKRALRYNKQLAKYQYDLNMQAWREQNEYNSPAAQMARYQEAGLNPRLVYGQGDNGNASPPPEYSGNYVDPEPVNDLGVGAAVDKSVSAWMAMQRFEEEQKNNAVQREAVQNKTLTETFERLNSMRNYARNSWEDQEAYRLGMSQAAVQWQNILKTQQEIRESENRILTSSQEFDLRQQLNEVQISLYKQQLEDLKQDHDWKKFEYSLRKDLKLIPGSTIWDRLFDLALNIGDKDDPTWTKLGSTFKRLHSWIKGDKPQKTYKYDFTGHKVYKYDKSWFNSLMNIQF